ncbi:DNA-directed RNA polymerase subunit delta [Virgibacillus profundi]|uniref:Probable DNA-directed RNA polymerase subunit delta n=1 Tax=Virgibacillus profundi TaxID=2024555 RepID=A0A2A2IJE5_9BACI|nr:DNA-directed RNA polymerase subunit delta [Virgibacillus profundi]PAV31384.1 DNA-directed RNA polymerase subunit delta [Virgibacillus profundi]PXY55570.1 DNA-directed RNA polymerase subunit delta [Virgibacillus profundi]
MSLKKYSHEELKSMSMIDLADLLLLEEKKAINFKDIFEKIAELKGLTKKEKQEYISQFYTDLNVNGHFITIGENMWGLKRWYPVEQMDEEVAPAPKKKKKKAKKKKKEVVEEELDIVDEDIEEIVDDLDEDEFEKELGEEELDEDDEDSDDEDDDEKAKK